MALPLPALGNSEVFSRLFFCVVGRVEGRDGVGFFGHGGAEGGAAEDVAVASPAQQLRHEAGDAGGGAGEPDGAIRLRGQEETAGPLPGAGVGGDWGNEQDVHRDGVLAPQAADDTARFEKGGPFREAQCEAGGGFPDAAHLIEGKGTNSLMAVAPAVQLPEEAIAGLDPVRVYGALGPARAAAAVVVEFDGAAGAGGILQNVQW